MTEYLVSIIIPAYNRADLIGETLDSVLAQTYPHWECIVVDDHSTDNTWEIVEGYCQRDSRIKLFRRPEDRPKGANACRNYGVELSSGEYLNFLDSDDLIHQDCIKIKIYHAKYQNSDIVISKNTREVNCLSEVVEEVRFFDSEQFDIDFILSRNNILIGDPIIRRGSLIETQFDESLHRLQDHDFLVRLFRRRHKYCIINCSLYYYRLTQNGITHKTGQGDRLSVNTQIKVFKNMIHYYRENTSVIDEYKRRSRKMYRNLLLKNRIWIVLENIMFFKSAFNRNFFDFLLYFVVNLTTKRGFERIGRKNHFNTSP